MMPRKPPRAWASPERAEEETFQPQISEMTAKIIEEKRLSVERNGEKPTRYIRPVDFVIYDP